MAFPICVACRCPQRGGFRRGGGTVREGSAEARESPIWVFWQPRTPSRTRAREDALSRTALNMALNNPGQNPLQCCVILYFQVCFVVVFSCQDELRHDDTRASRSRGLGQVAGPARGAAAAAEAPLAGGARIAC